SHEGLTRPGRIDQSRAQAFRLSRSLGEIDRDQTSLAKYLSTFELPVFFQAYDQTAGDERLDVHLGRQCQLGRAARTDEVIFGLEEGRPALDHDGTVASEVIERQRSGGDVVR